MDDTDIRQLETIQQELAAAWIARDRTTLERLIAPDWMVTHVAGQRLTRSDVLRDMLESSATRIESMTVDEVSVRLFGDAAVVTGRTHARGVQAGAAFDVSLRFTDVFVRRNDRWQAVASHATLVGSQKSEVYRP
jgi:ketosteroid isomerase-like protein